METHVSIMFNGFSMPSNENITTSMELLCEGKNIKFNFPLSSPIKLTFSPKFVQDKIALSLTANDPHSKKTKILARGDVIIFKAIFSEKPIYEKTITMIPPESIKDLKKSGKIFMQIQLIDSFEEWKKNLKNSGKKNTNTKLIKKQTNQDSSGINNIETPVKNQFDDNLSNVSLSNLEDNDELKGFELDELISLDHINKLKQVLENDYINILPSDINILKALNQTLYQKYQELSNKYNDILASLNSANENIRTKAIQYWNDYKKLKKEFYKERIELKNKQNQLDNEMNINKKENEEIQKNLQKYNDEKDVFLQKLSNSEGNDAQNLAVISNSDINNDIKMLRDAIKKISSLGYNIIEGLDINDDEKKILSVVVGTNLEDNVNNEYKDNNINNNNIENIDDNVNNNNENAEENYDYELSNEIVRLIERDVNDLFMKKLIKMVKIDQIDTKTYEFSVEEKDNQPRISKQVSFTIQNNNLICSTGESFTVWLISNFSL